MIEMELPYLPPSSNHAYFNLPKGGRTLTKVGKKFKTESSTHLMRIYHSALTMFKKDVAYGLAFIMFFENLENSTWPSVAANRYKKLDVSNRLKLLEDVISEDTGVDDSQCLMVIGAKAKAQPGKERTVILAWNLAEESMVDVIERFRSIAGFRPL